MVKAENTNGLNCKITMVMEFAMDFKPKNNYDVAVVGSGPGGATCARELARAGKKVLLLEMGKTHRRMRSYLTAAQVLDGHGLLRAKEGMPIFRALTTGGASVVYSASAADPPPWLKPRYGIDLEPWLPEIKKETGYGVLPEELWGKSSAKVMETANKIGYKWEPMPKFLNPDKFVKGRCCGAETHLGCSCGAKWTAREYVREAMYSGAHFLDETECERVMVEGGAARGLLIRMKSGERLRVNADRVILAAGGIGSPMLLKKAGVDGAGDGCFVDPTVVVYGKAPFEGTHLDPPVSVVSWEFYESHGIRLGTMMEPRWLFAINSARISPSRAISGFSYGNMVGILAKVKDDLTGGVDADGVVSKPLTDDDQARLKKGKQVAADILRALDCKSSSIFESEVKGAHPSGTCRIGQVVDSNLKTGIGGLYVCDASVFPEALDRPTVMTIIGLAKRLCAHLES